MTYEELIFWIQRFQTSYETERDPVGIAAHNHHHGFAHGFGDKFRVGTCQDQCFSAIPLQHYNLPLYLFLAFQHVSLPGEPDSDY